MPHTTCAATMVTNSGAAPQMMKPAPITAMPMMIDRRRLYTSASTPVGTSNSKQDASSAVPTSTSCSGDRPASVTAKTPVTTNTVLKNRAWQNAMARYSG